MPLIAIIALSAAVHVTADDITDAGETIYGVNGVDGPAMAEGDDRIELLSATGVRELPRWGLAYDDRDRVTSVEAPDGRRLSIDYDDHDRVRSITSGAEKQGFDYDQADNLVGFEDATGSTRLEHDEFGRLKAMTYPTGETVSYGYTEDGRIASVALGDGHFLRYQRDLFGNVVRLDTPAGTFRFEYDYNNRRLRRIYPNGAVSVFLYNLDGRATHIRHVASDGKPVVEFAYDYNDAGLLERAIEQNGNGEVEIRYGYDAYGQLLSADYSDGRRYEYEYDTRGNRLRATGPDGNTVATYDDLDQLETLNGEPVSHDPAGQITSLDGQNLLYDTFGRLVSDGKRQYAYNALALRTEVADSAGARQHIHLIDDLPFLLAEVGDGVTRYIWSDGQVLGQIGPKGEPVFYFEDQLGSIRTAMDTSSRSIGTGEFSPFGQPVQRIPGVAFGFAGEEQNQDGTVFLRARYYEPKLGRFLSKDPVLPDPTAKARENTYAYVANSPSNYSDGDGERKQQVRNPFDRLHDSNRMQHRLQYKRDRLLQKIKQVQYRNQSQRERLLRNIDRMQRNIGRARENAQETLREASQKMVREAADQLAGQIGYKSLATAAAMESLKVAFPNITWSEASRSSVRFTNIPLSTLSSQQQAAMNKSWWKFTQVPGLNYSDRNHRWWHSGSGIRLSTTRSMNFARFLGVVSTLSGAVSNAVSAFETAQSYRKIIFNALSNDPFQERHRLGPSRYQIITRGGYTHTIDLDAHAERPDISTPSVKHTSTLDSLQYQGSPISEFPLQHPISHNQRIPLESKAVANDLMSSITDAQTVLERYNVSGGPGRVAGPGGYASDQAIAAVDAFRSLGASRIPNVGGVYLDQAAEVIGNLGNVEAVSFDPASNRLVLIGGDATDKQLPPVRLDHMAVAFRSVFGATDLDPGVTIDPDPEDPHGDTMIVRFFGGVEQTHFGHVLFEADRVMKALSLGEDNISHKKTGVDVEGYHDLVELGFSNLGNGTDGELWSRFWLVPDRVMVQVSPDKKTIAFPETRIRVKTETMRWLDGKLVPAGGERDEKAEYFAAHFTKHYDEYARELPIFAELKTLANMVALAKWLKASGVPVDLDWLEAYDEPLDTPETTPSLTVADEWWTRKGDHVEIERISVFGGTDLTINNRYVEADAAVSQMGQAARTAVAAELGVASATLLGPDGEVKSVVALPTSGTRAVGAEILRAGELLLFDRVFSSSHNGVGPFGRSWNFDLPRLRVARSSPGERQILTIADQSVEKRTYRLTSPFGLRDVRFDEHSFDHESDRIVVHPERLDDVRGLYPDDERQEFRIEYRDGAADVFRADGRLIRRELGDGLVQHFRYDASGLLTSASIESGGQKTLVVNLTYDEQRRVTTASIDGEEISYVYKDERLVQVEAENGTLSYAYDHRHLVTEVRWNGEVVRTLRYDDYGRVVDSNGSPVATYESAAATIGGGTIVRRPGGLSQSFDAAGRLVEARDETGRAVTVTYHPTGAVKSVDTTDADGTGQRLELSPDGRYVVETNADGQSQAVLFDEQGRLRQLQEDGRAILRRQYGRTEDGLVETTETPEVTTQIVYDPNTGIRKRVVASKIPSGGHLVDRVAYGESGSPDRRTVEGLVTVDQRYENGRLVSASVGDKTTAFTYDADGRPIVITGPNERTELGHDEGGLARVSTRRGDLKIIHAFDDDRLVSRTSTSGLHDVFGYDSDGRLSTVTRADGEQWNLNYKDGRVETTRNGIPQSVFSYDEAGRLTEVRY